MKYWTFTIETNEGEGNSKWHGVDVYLSHDNALDSGDKWLGHRGAPYLAAGDFGLIPVKIKVPETENDGNHFLFVKVDAKDKIKEVSEDNNALSKAAKIVSHDTHGQHLANHDNQDD